MQAEPCRGEMVPKGEIGKRTHPRQPRERQGRKRRGGVAERRRAKAQGAGASRREESALSAAQRRGKPSASEAARESARRPAGRPRPGAGACACADFPARRPGRLATRRARFGGLPSAMAHPRISTQLPPDIDPTKAPVAFGRRGLPKLNEELQHPELLTRQRALMALCDLVHDPENAYQAIGLGERRRRAGEGPGAQRPSSPACLAAAALRGVDCNSQSSAAPSAAPGILGVEVHRS